MRKSLIALGAVIALLLGAPLALGQMMTEQFIPMGQSPGLSGKFTDLGEIKQVDVEGRTITLGGAAGGRAVAVTERTRIWLDRSKLQQTSVAGSFADLRKGRQVEVKYEDDERRQTAAWIKVESTRK
jgi:hypothetical protein